MRRWLALWLLLPSSAWAAGSLVIPGGSGRITSFGQIGDLGCSTGDAQVWTAGVGWGCGAVSPGSGDSGFVNGLGVTDLNLIDTTGDGAVTWTRDTVPNPDTAAAIVKDGAISPAKMKSTDFGLFTCNGTTCTVNPDSVALGVRTTGNYIDHLNASAPLQSTGCNSEGAVCALTFDTTAPLVLSAKLSSSTSLIPPTLGSTPDPLLCDAPAEYGGLYTNQSNTTGDGVYYCTPSGWILSGHPAASLSGFSVDSISQTTVDFQDGGDINFTAAGGVVTGAVKADSVALITKTTGNFVQSATATGAITCTGCAATEGSQPSFTINAGAIGATELSSTVGSTVTTCTNATVNLDADGRVNSCSNGVVTSPYSSVSGLIQSSQSLDNLAVGPAVNRGKLSVNGDTEEIQLNVRGNAGQTNSLINAEDSAGSSKFSVAASGAVTSASSISSTDRTTGNGNLITLNDNDVNLTPDPTCAGVGVAGVLTIIDKDESAADAWVVCDGTTEILNLSVPSIGLTNLTTAAKIQTSCVSLSVMAQNVFVFKVPASVTANAVRVSCVSSGVVTTAPTYTLQECATDGSACSSVHASPITCGATEGTTGTFTDSSWAASAWMRLLSGNTGIVAGMTQFCVDWTPS